MAKYRHNVTQDMLGKGDVILYRHIPDIEVRDEEETNDILEAIFEAMLNAAPDSLIERWAGEREL